MIFYVLFTTSNPNVCPRSLRPVGSAPPGPLAAGARPLHLLRSALPPSPGSLNCVEHYMPTVTSFVGGATKSVAILSDATPVARLRAAVFRKDRFPQQTVYSIIHGRFCGTFSAAPAHPRVRRSSLWSRPARVCATHDPRQGSPCTCPAPPEAKPGLCFSRNFADEDLRTDRLSASSSHFLTTRVRK